MQSYGISRCTGYLFATLLVASSFYASAQQAFVPDNRKLNGDLVDAGDVTDKFSASPDGQRVVYVADQDIEGVDELYSVPFDGGTVTKLNPPLAATFRVFDFLITPDSSTVVYNARQDSNGIVELYSVPISGGTATKLHPPLALSQNINNFKLSPDGSTVVFTADLDNTSVMDVYSAPVSGGTPTKLNPTFTPASSKNVNPNHFKISPNGSTVVYLADQDTDGQVEVYSVPIGGGATTKINDPLPGSADVTHLFASQDIFFISPDNATIIFYADPDTDDLFELFSAPIGGGGATKLNDPVVANGVIGPGATFTPDSSRVIYIADQDTFTVPELYSVPAGGGTVTKLHTNLTPGEFVRNFKVSSDSSTVVFLAQIGPGEVELFSIPAAGGTPTKLNTPTQSSWDVANDYLISSDSGSVYYLLDQDTAQEAEIYRVPIAGGTPVRVNEAFTGTGFIYDFKLSSDETAVVYRATLDTFTIIRELFHVAASDNSQATRMHPAQTVGRDVLPGYQIVSADGRSVVYRADQSTNTVDELYATNLLELSLPIGGLWPLIAAACALLLAGSAYARRSRRN